MTPEQIRHASAADLAALSALCLRSKAHWGYDADFLAACVGPLTVHASDLSDPCAVARGANGGFVGFVRVAVKGGTANLEKLFVNPVAIGSGLGRRLFTWGVDQARAAGARDMIIVSDPGAVPFYERMGAIQNGAVPSEAIPGRLLPRLVLHLQDSPIADAAALSHDRR